MTPAQREKYQDMKLTEAKLIGGDDPVSLLDSVALAYSSRRRTDGEKTALQENLLARRKARQRGLDLEAKNDTSKAAQTARTRRDDTRRTHDMLNDFMLIAAANGGMWVHKPTLSPDEFAKEVGNYVSVVQEIGMHPTVGSLCLWFGCSENELREHQYSADEIGQIFEKFCVYIQEYHAANGLNASTNPAFQMFYNKCMLGWREQPTEVKLSVTDGRGGPVQLNSAVDGYPVIDVAAIEI